MMEKLNEIDFKDSFYRHGMKIKLVCSLMDMLAFPEFYNYAVWLEANLMSGGYLNWHFGSYYELIVVDLEWLCETKFIYIKT